MPTAFDSEDFDPKAYVASRMTEGADEDSTAEFQKSFDPENKAAQGTNIFGGWIKNLPKNISVGMLDATLAAANFAEDAVDALPAEPGKPAKAPEPKDITDAPLKDTDFGALDALQKFRDFVAAGSTTSDQVTQGVAQFAVPFAGWSRAFGGIKKAHGLARNLATAAGAEVATSSVNLLPETGRMADLVELGRHAEGRFGDALRAITPDGSLQTAYVNWMTDREDEGPWEGRFKNSVDSLVGSAAVGGLIKGAASSFRQARSIFSRLGETANEVQLEPKADVRSRLDEMLEQAAKRDALESQGQQILDDMADAGVKTSQVAEQFWNDTYWKLGSAGQRRFQKYVKNMTGFEPGSVLGVYADGRPPDVAKDWNHIGLDLRKDMADDPEDLEGVERGYVALMKWANDQAGAMKDAPVSEPARLKGERLKGKRLVFDDAAKATYERVTDTILARYQDIKAEAGGSAKSAERPIAMSDLLADLDKNVPADDPYRVVVDKLLKQDLKGKVRILGGKAYKELAGETSTGKSFTRMHRENDEIVLNLDTLSKTGRVREAVGYAAMHELVHAGTVRNMRRTPEIADTILELSKKTKEAAPDGPKYGHTNAFEFVAEAFSNMRFQSAMKKAGTWDPFIKEIGKIFGISGAALVSLETLIQQPQEKRTDA